MAGSGKDKGKGDASNWIVVQINNLKNSSTTKQTVVGASAGLITGYATGKLGRTVGYMVGGTILLVNVSSESFADQFAVSIYSFFGRCSMMNT